jgi:hypothetical protein
MELLNADLPDCDVQGQLLPSLAAYFPGGLQSTRTYIKG